MKSIAMALASVFHVAKQHLQAAGTLYTRGRLYTRPMWEE